MDFETAFADLHSNMVRFIMQLDYFRQAYGYIIYIPIWLDLLLVTPLSVEVGFLLFTFQYG